MVKFFLHSHLQINSRTTFTNPTSINPKPKITTRSFQNYHRFRGCAPSCSRVFLVTTINCDNINSPEWHWMASYVSLTCPCNPTRAIVNVTAFISQCNEQEEEEKSTASILFYLCRYFLLKNRSLLKLIVTTASGASSIWFWSDPPVHSLISPSHLVLTAGEYLLYLPIPQTILCANPQPLHRPPIRPPDYLQFSSCCYCSSWLLLLLSCRMDSQQPTSNPPQREL